MQEQQEATARLAFLGRCCSCVAKARDQLWIIAARAELVSKTTFWREVWWQT